MFFIRANQIEQTTSAWTTMEFNLTPEQASRLYKEPQTFLYIGFGKEPAVQLHMDQGKLVKIKYWEEGATAMEREIIEAAKKSEFLPAEGSVLDRENLAEFLTDIALFGIDEEHLP